jgi:hypothetical protein
MFNDFLEVLKENHFVEKPVDVKTFVQSPEYLGQPLLSDIQYEIVEAILINILRMNLYFNLARDLEKTSYQQ